MKRHWFQSRKLLISIGMLISLILIVYFTDPSLAAPAASTKGTSFLGALAGIGGTMTTLILIGQAVRMFGGVLLTIAANALDFAFQWNTTNIFTNAVSGEPLATFWGYARDLVNGVLILILLWIAFGVIFNLERFNARRLLVRVILVGLLINFSLTLTSSVFSLANALAQPFAEQLKKSGGVEPGKTDPATGGPVYRGMSVKIVEITNIHTVMNAASRDVETLKNLAERQEAGGSSVPDINPAAPPAVQGPSGNEEVVSNPVPQQQPEKTSSLLANDAEAVLPALLIPAAYGALKLIGVTVAATSITSFLEQFALGQNSMGAIGAVSAGAWTLFLNPFVGGLFLLVATFVIGSLAIIFMVRGIMIMILAILSPLAFAALVIPGQDKYFKMWMGKLINWSFFAPISFFLLLFAMHMGDKIQEASVAAAKRPELQANLPAAFQFALILGLLISALAIAKYMGIQLAATLMNVGEKYAKAGLGVAKGFAWGTARRAVIPRLGEAGGKMETWVGKQGAFAQRLLRFPTIGLRGVTGFGRAETGKAREELRKKRRTPEELQRMIAQEAFLTATDRTAAVLELASMKKLAALPGIEGYREARRNAMETAASSLHRMGSTEQLMEILKADPTLSEKKYFAPERIEALRGEVNVLGYATLSDEQKDKVAAQLYLWKRIDPSDMAKLDTTATFNDPQVVFNIAGRNVGQGELSRKLFFNTSDPEHLGRMMRDDPATGASLNEELTVRKNEIIPLLPARTYAYLLTPQARAVGWIIPPDHENFAPISALQNNLGTLESSVQDLNKTLQTPGASPRLVSRTIDRLQLEIARWSSVADRLRDRGIQRPDLPNNLRLNFNVQLDPRINIPPPGPTRGPIP